MNNNKLYQLQKKIYQTTKRKALSYEGASSPELKQYRRDQNFFSKRPFVQVTTDEMLNRVKQSQIIYLGDFHTFDQSSRNYERLLRVLIDLPRPFILGLEMIHEEDQIYIDAYLAGEITELELLQCINYHHSWRFPWNHYQQFFHSAKKNGFSIVGLNSNGNLKQRDSNCARSLVQIIQQNPDTKILVLFGELHIVPDKIPLEVTKLLKLKNSHDFQQLIVHQNIDEVYWSTKEDPQKNVVRFSENEYCIQSSPPWMKYESMIYWYENLCDDPEFDIHEYIIEKGFKLLGGHAQDQFYQICKQILETLGDSSTDPSPYQDFSLYDHKDLQKLSKNLQKIKLPRLKTYITDALTSHKLVRIDESFYYYCSGYSINRLAYLAGQYLFHKQIELKQLPYFELILHRTPRKRLGLFIQQSICGHLASKIINPFRKCDLYQDLLHQSKDKHRKISLVAQTCLKVIDRQVDIDQLFKGKRLFFYLEVGEKIGHMLGDILFEQYQKANSPSSLISHFYFTDFSEQRFNELVYTTLESLDYKTGKKRYF